jgi:hypothetical protein
MRPRAPAPEAVLLAFGLPTTATTLAAFSQFKSAHTQRQRRKVTAPAPPPVLMPAGLVCAGCGNADESCFDATMDTAELVCTACGVVAVDHMLYEGQAEREFADDAEEESRVHASFPQRYGHLLSAGHNLATIICGGDRGTEPILRARAREEHPTLNRCATTAWRRDTDTLRCIAAMEQAAACLGASPDAQADAIERFAAARRGSERMLAKEVQMAACLATAMAAHARKVVLPIPRGEPTVECPTCAVRFYSTTERAQHAATSPACRAAAAKKEVKLSKRMRASMDCNFDVYAPF